MARAERVVIKHFRHQGTAECEQCKNLHPDSTRERCRVHVRQTGHRVRFVIEDVTTYDPAGSPR
jgi:hypothetical protein